MNRTLTLRPAFTPFTILLMVLGFIVFWPLGLIMLAFILWGDRFQGMGERMRGHPWAQEFHGCGPRGHWGRSYPSSGNLAFDEYRQRELKRLEEERRRLDDERREFETYVRNLQKAKDQEEFDRFMAERRNARRGEATDI